jgi:hypothetical protein
MNLFRAPGAGPANAWATALIPLADTDNDNQLSPAELTLLVAKTFCLADRDHDDHLDERELAEALDLLATTNAAR